VHIVERRVIGRSTESYLVAESYSNSESYQVAIGKHALIRACWRDSGSGAFAERSAMYPWVSIERFCLVGPCVACNCGESSVMSESL